MVFTFFLFVCHCEGRSALHIAAVLYGKQSSVWKSCVDAEKVASDDNLERLDQLLDGASLLACVHRHRRPFTRTLIEMLL